MKEFKVLMVLCLIKLTSQQHNRVPPGVPPQQYAQQHGHQMQQPHVPVQHQVPMQQIPQHQQVQHQQVPVQHQQVPVPHQQVPVQHQQVPVQHQQQVPQVPVQQQQFAVPQHHGAHAQQHHPGGQLLNVAHMAQENKEHMKEHLNVPIDTSNMSEQELQFHYFKMHDADNNNKLDGCELIKSLIHWHVSHQDESDTILSVFSDEEVINVVDPVMIKADKNNDGFLDYFEYVEHSTFHKDILP